MQISLSDIGKRFNRDWIFRKLSKEFVAGEYYAITGPNGSGKSTLLQIIAGAVTHSEGNVRYVVEGKKLEPEKAFTHVSIAAPYQELIEEMTLIEFLEFHKKFKPLLAGVTVEKIISTIGLHASSHKQIRYYSSGMKQRVKLAQAIFSNTPLVLLDEPCTNLDIDGIQLYHKLINDYCGGRSVIVSSNDEQEINFCRQRIDIMQFKMSAGSRSVS
jgi:ABC-type multidrug transport system ATPase subunit